MGPLLSSLAGWEILWIFLLGAEGRANFGAWFGDEAGALRKRSGRCIFAGKFWTLSRKKFAPQVISLSVADFNHRAQQLYLNMGFEVVRRIPQESNGDIHLFVEMEKKV